MAHHYDGYQVETRWNISERTIQLGALHRAIEIIESLDDSDSIANQETLAGLKSVLDKIRSIDYQEGEI